MSNAYDASKSWTTHDRLRDLRHRMGLVRHGAKAEMANLLGVSAARYGQWESGARKPDDRDLRRAVALLGLAEEEGLMNYLLDPFGTVAPPSWWSASGPVPRVGDPPRDPRWTSEPAKPGDRPRLSPGDAQALAAERRARIQAESRADDAERALAEREAQLVDVNAQLHAAAEVIDDLVRTRRREGREADERLAVLAGALAEAERASAARPRPPRTVIVVEGDVVEVRETA